MMINLIGLGWHVVCYIQYLWRLVPWANMIEKPIENMAKIVLMLVREKLDWCWGVQGRYRGWVEKEQKTRISLICILATEGRMHDPLFEYGVQRLWKSKLREAVRWYRRYEEFKELYGIVTATDVRWECF